MSSVNTFGTRTPLTVGAHEVQVYSLTALEASGFPEVARLPYSLKILLENLLRHRDTADGRLAYERLLSVPAFARQLNTSSPSSIAMRCTSRSSAR